MASAARMHPSFPSLIVRFKTEELPNLPSVDAEFPSLIVRFKTNIMHNMVQDIIGFHHS